MAHRRMRERGFHQSQVDATYDRHIAPINRLVDVLRNESGRGWMPYVAPDYGGVEARVLLLLRDPGPKTNSEDGYGGSGFICLENDDPTAERLAKRLDQAGLTAADCVAWNAYPWYINQSPDAAQLEAGVDALYELLELLPRLEVVLLLGNDAQKSWRRLIKRHPTVGERYRVIETRHTSDLAFIGTPEKKAHWKAEQVAAFQEAAQRLGRMRPALDDGQT